MNGNICRICLQEDKILISLFSKQGDFSPYEKLVYKLKIEISKVGPPTICCQCLKELDDSLRFLEKCVQSNKIISAKHNGPANLHFQSGLLACDSRDDEAIAKDQAIDIENLEGNSTGTNLGEQAQEQPTCKLCIKCGRNCKHHSPTVYTCQICQKVFNRKFNYNIHVKRHLGQREWPCPICSTAQVSSWLARRHCRPRARLPCPMLGCTHSYTSGHNLAVHIRTHTGERPHVCSECGKRFTSRTTLNDHTRTHTGVKPYMCSICGARFATNKLAAHLRTHAPKLRLKQSSIRESARSQASLHACTHCSLRYAHKQSLNRHLKKRHAFAMKSNIATDSSHIECFTSETAVNNVR